MGEGFHAPLCYVEGSWPSRFVVFVDANGGHSGVISDALNGDIEVISSFRAEEDRFVYAINVKPKVKP